MPAMWERQPQDTQKSFVAFSAYLSLPPDRRTILSTCNALGYPATSVSLLQKWSSQTGWPERAAAYDNYRANIAIEVRNVDLIDAQQQQAAKMSLAVNLGMELGVQMLNRIREDFLNEKKVDTKDMLRIAEMLVKLDTAGRRNLGLPTNYKTETVDEPNMEGQEFMVLG